MTAPTAEQAQLAQKSPEGFYITKNLSIHHLNLTRGRGALQNHVEQFPKRFASSLWASSKLVTAAQSEAVAARIPQVSSSSINLLRLSVNKAVWCKRMGHQVHTFHIETDKCECKIKFYY